MQQPDASCSFSCTISSYHWVSCIEPERRACQLASHRNTNAAVLLTRLQGLQVSTIQLNESGVWLFINTHRLQQQRQQQQQALLAPPQASSSGQADAGEELVPDTEFSITKISYGSILTPLGIFLLAYGFGAFFQLLPGADVSPLLLIYGFPISLLGFALAYAQVGLFR
eukprot:1156284-Pelagomonas_calceolata.AAC.7